MGIGRGIGIGLGGGQFSWVGKEPSAASATSKSDTSATVVWTDPSDTGADGIKIYTSDDNGASWDYNSSVAYGVQTKDVTGLTANTLYKFKVVSYKGSKISDGVTTNNQRTFLTRNSDIVWSGGYSSIATNDGLTGYVYINKNNWTTSRINGTISKIQIRLKTRPTGAGKAFWFRVYRKNGTVYDRVYEEDIASKITATDTTVEVTLGAGCNVLEGDFVSISATGGALGDFNIGYVNLGLANSLRYGALATYEPPDATGEDFDAYPSALGWIHTIRLLAQAPMAVIIGDSIMAGHPGHYSGVESSLVNVPSNSISGQLYTLNNNYVIQNMAVGSTQIAWVNTKYNDYIKALKPKYLIVGSGVNDIAVGTVTKADYINAYTTLLDNCETDGILPIVCKIFPWTNGTNTQMQTRDDWMADLSALVATYSGAKFVNFDDAVGKFRVGGDAGNKWDIQTSPNYAADGVHLNAAGYAVAAATLDAAIRNT